MPALPPPPSLDELNCDNSLALFLDFDGTLVDLAPTPDSIAVPAHLAASLHALGDRFGGRVALVSGRAIVDLERHLGAISLAAAGSHGSHCRAANGENLGEEPGGLPADLLRQVRRFADENGFRLEDKPHGAALHCRANPSLEPLGVEFAAELAAKHALDVKRGKFVIELVGRGANKGSALRTFMAQAPFAGSTPVFVGDDITDEDGMRAAAEFGGFGVIVGERESDAAKYGLESPAAVQHWLKL